MKPRISRSKLLRTFAADTFREVPPAPFKPDPGSWRDDAVTISWLGHATVLIDFFGIKILTDPVLAARAGIRIGPLVIGPKRYIAPALSIEELPPIDLVLLTHAHMDHLDTWTLRRLGGRPRVVTARAISDLLDRKKFRAIHELDWGGTHSFDEWDPPLRIEALPVVHWGARMRHDSHRGYCGFLLERAGCRICFAGDTARTSTFAALGDRGGVDVFIVPIGAYDPWIANHCNPEEAVAMADEARARYLVPIHHQTFKLSWEPMHEPIQRFCRALQSEPERIAITEIGQTFVLPRE